MASVYIVLVIVAHLVFLTGVEVLRYKVTKNLILKNLKKRK